MIVIPMAGKSSRFYNAGYTLPKFKLPLNNRTVFEEAINSFKNYFESDLFLFVTRTDDGSFDFVTEKCLNLGVKNFKIVSIDFDTKGQADTVSIGLNHILSEIDTDEPLYIFNIDSIRVNFSKPDSKFLENVYGYLEVFEGEGEHWSFVDPLPNNIVHRTTEKNRISNLCSNGLYYFKTINLFNSALNKMKAANEYNELFVAPMYNFLIQENLKVKYVLVNQNETLFSGTPAEYEELNKYFNLSKVCLFISSSRNTSDVLENSLKLNSVFFRNIDFDIVIGANNYNTKTEYPIIDGGGESTWKSEILSQLVLLKSKYTHIVFFLDDFVIFQMNKKILMNAINDAIKNELNYVLLEKERPCFWKKYVQYNEFFNYRNKDYYYTSLKVSFWRIDYFIKLLNENFSSIWEFEHLIKGQHYSVKNKIFEYDHMVEKGKYRKKVLNSLDLDLNLKDRKIVTENSFRILLKKIKFYFFGYKFTKLKR